ncbi:MAG: tripartite tricarboxylate transporter substrate binding protein, partial [Burkholderiales bacterium]
MFRLLSCFVCCALLPVAHAQIYPAKPVRLIVPWPAGGTTDILGRVIGQKLNEAWGQPVVIENRGGAAGNIGTELVVKALPDGYVLLFGNMGTHATNQFMYSGMTFDPVADLAPISLIANVGTVLVVHPNLPVKNVKELVALAKKRPGQLDFASGGVGSFNQLCAELL